MDTSGLSDRELAVAALAKAEAAATSAEDSRKKLSGFFGAAGIGIGNAMAMLLSYSLHGFDDGVFWMGMRGVFGWLYVLWMVLGGKVSIF